MKEFTIPKILPSPLFWCNMQLSVDCHLSLSVVNFKLISTSRNALLSAPKFKVVNFQSLFINFSLICCLIKCPEWRRASPLPCRNTGGLAFDYAEMNLMLTGRNAYNWAKFEAAAILLLSLEEGLEETSNVSLKLFNEIIRSYLINYIVKLLW